MVNRKVKRSVSRKTRRSTYRKKNSKANRRGLAFASRKLRRTRRTRRQAKRSRRQRGGDYLESLGRPFFASVYPTVLQDTYASWTGAQPNNYPAPLEPENSKLAEHSWKYINQGTPISPDVITKINSGFTMIAQPGAYSNTPLTADGTGVSSGTATAPGSVGSGNPPLTNVPQTSIATQMQIGREATQSF